MKNEMIAKVLALFVLLGSVGVAPVMAEDDKPETPMGEQMDVLSGSLKGLRRADGFEAKAELARKAQAALIKAMQYQPAIFNDIKDPKAKAVASADFKRLMGLTLAGLGELELAFLNEDEEKAEAVADRLKDLKKEGHEAYVKEEE